MVRRLLRRLVRSFAKDCNPLRRPVDRLESSILASLVVAFFVAGPLLCIGVGLLVHQSGVRTEQSEQHSYGHVKATLLEDGVRGQSAQDGTWDYSWVKAKWTYNGMAHTERIPVPLNAVKNSTVTIWVTPSGQQTTPPLSNGDIRMRTMLAVVSAAVGLAVLLAVAAVIVRVTCDRKRIAGWQRDWDATGPQWTSRR